MIGNIQLEDGTLFRDELGSFTHTGLYSVLARPQEQALSFTFTASKDRDYKSQVWVYSPGVDLQDEALIQVYTAGTLVYSSQIDPEAKAKQWNVVTLNFEALAGRTYTVVCTNPRAGGSRELYFDDFACRPTESAFSAYIYNRKDGQLSHTIDSENFYTRYEYNQAGELLRISREHFESTDHILSEGIQHIKGQQAIK